MGQTVRPSSNNGLASVPCVRWLCLLGSVAQEKRPASLRVFGTDSIAWSFLNEIVFSLRSPSGRIDRIELD